MVVLPRFAFKRPLQPPRRRPCRHRAGPRWSAGDLPGDGIPPGWVPVLLVGRQNPVDLPRPPSDRAGLEHGLSVNYARVRGWALPEVSQLHPVGGEDLVHLRRRVRPRRHLPDDLVTDLAGVTCGRLADIDQRQAVRGQDLIEVLGGIAVGALISHQPGGALARSLTSTAPAPKTQVSRTVKLTARNPMCFISTSFGASRLDGDRRFSMIPGGKGEGVWRR